MNEKSLMEMLVVKTIVVRKSLGPKGPYGFESHHRYKFINKCKKIKIFLVFLNIYLYLCTEINYGSGSGQTHIQNINFDSSFSFNSQ